ncbi:DUF3048 domain-containing protein [Streptomyces sp. P38-E01]|uniref:DUF3048 domain-containing protein n=1 Tax=Streptomyces tardus TaxID=2780544 RepID=A0A949N8N5_9ACTN|nr:DUF3048 domain-containing protein [Streptomyces tardus]MBU7598098.1 DUF3048 domain-containing protein [Streptomyces tardus]
MAAPPTGFRNRHRSPARAGAAPSPRPRPRSAVLALALALVGSLALAGSSSADGSAGTAPLRSSSPYTGEPAVPAPVLALKVDNSARARPHVGLERADMVYVEKVEAGMSRLMAVYASEQAPVAGPVRSARESDLELLRQFGRPALAYSGVQKKLQPHIERAPLYPVPQEKNRDAYFRDQDRPSPHNLFMQSRKVLDLAPRASLSRDIGLRFGPAPAGGRPTRQASVSYDAARTSFEWSPKQRRWLASFDGEPAMSASGARLGGRTVVIQRVTMRDSDFGDSTGAVTPYIETLGEGTATVLRNGRAYETRWERATPQSGTVYRLADGSRMPFAAGQTWVVYADR